MKKTNRVYGLAGIRSIMSNWNADFSGRPKHTSKNEIYGSDKAFKYPIKSAWVNQGEKVLYIKSYKDEKGKLQPCTLKERYENLFEPLAKESPKVLGNLFQAIDVMNFGATFAEGTQSFSITGAVQVGQGFNLYKGTRIEVQDILSPFRNSSKEDAEATSLGTKTVVDRAHYCYPFTVNPFSYDVYVGLAENFEGYTEEAYQKLKLGLLGSATAFATNSKYGCDNEYSIFVEMKTGSLFVLPDLAQLVTLQYEKGSTQLNLEKLNALLNTKISDEIDRIEVYYDPYQIQLQGLEHNKAIYYNIYSREVI
jgi:CRISPR-associated protein Csh2